MSLIWTPRQALFALMEATSANAVDSSSASYDSTASLRFNTDGNVEGAGAIDGAALSYSTKYQFCIPASVASLYEVRVTNVDHNAGTNPGSGWSTTPGADGTWFALSGIRTWSTNETAAGSYDTTATVEIGFAGKSTALASATWTWSIENTS